jgi:hypothetical protein
MDSLAKVDQLVFIFRRLIVPLDKFAPDEFLTFREILKNEPHHIGSRNMPLGKAIFDIDSRVRNIALNSNLSFSPSQYVHNWDWVISTFRESSIDRHIVGLIQGGTNEDDVRDALDLAKWLIDNITLPKELGGAIKQLLEAGLDSEAAISH